MYLVDTDTILRGCSLESDGEVSVKQDKLVAIRFFVALVFSLILVLLFAKGSVAYQASGDVASGTSETMHGPMDPHMTMTPARPATAEDLYRAHIVLAATRAALSRYQDYRVALADGYKPFLPDTPQPVYHFVSESLTLREYERRFDLKHPGSLLYVSLGSDRYLLIGAMYSAPADSTAAELDSLVPSSIVSWHAHVNVCLPRGITLSDLASGNIGADRLDMVGKLDAGSDRTGMIKLLNRRFGFMADGRFGFQGKISDQRECEAAGGYFVKQAWGWMAHVYPFTGDDPQLAFGH